jgi:chromatin remodeling complex protein RSC6
MVLAQVKQLVDIFNVEGRSEDGKPLNKEDTIENLLDFLGQPHSDFIATAKEEKPSPKKKAAPKKKKTAAKKAKKAKAAAPLEDTFEDTFELVRAHKKGKTPSDAALRQWVKAYIVCFDMDSATTKHAIKTASDKFGVDLTGSKDRIKELLAEEM